MSKILLLEPNFPIAPKSRNHKNFLPIGLLKIGSYLKKSGIKIKLKRGFPQNIEEIKELKKFDPEEIWVTSLFTYWAGFVSQTINFYKILFPNSKIVVGGIFASLFPPEIVKEITGCDEVHCGIIEEAEEVIPDYSLLNGLNSNTVDYQIVHTSRGCPRKCSFCGTWKIEPQFKAKKTIKDEIFMKKVVLYDNNFLMNPFVENILEEFAKLRRDRKIEWVESQSGFDGRILLKNQNLAKLIKQAGFRSPRIAWDGHFEEFPQIKEQVEILKKAGFLAKEISVFMLYNWEIPFEEMEEKRIKCFKMGVQISDCRFRPLNQLYDNYEPRKIGQTIHDYYIHEIGGWTDYLVKIFRKNVREQNICIRHNFSFYSKELENKKGSKEFFSKLKCSSDPFAFLKSKKIPFWRPSDFRNSF